jgi:hypothetical protein
MHRKDEAHGKLKGGHIKGEKQADGTVIAAREEVKDAPSGKRQLDEGLRESMDGSDPPSALQP